MLIPIGIPTKETQVEIETHQVIHKTEIKKCSV